MAKQTRGDTLYNLATSAVIKNFSKLRNGLELCPENILFDVIYQIYSRNSNPNYKNERNKR